MRFISYKTKAALVAPAAFDAAWVKRSSQTPAFYLSVNHIYGTYSWNSILFSLYIRQS
jgi:hypothetical protein